MLIVRRMTLSLACGGLAATLAAGLALAAGSAKELSGFHGVVYRGPITPVCRTNEPCEAPAPGVVLRFGREGSPARTVKTDADGAYRILLPAAIYSVTTNQRPPGKQPSPHRVKVRLAHVDRLDFYIDTGIR
jgi:hypothetical protein